MYTDVLVTIQVYINHYKQDSFLFGSIKFLLNLKPAYEKEP